MSLRVYCGIGVKPRAAGVVTAVLGGYGSLCGTGKAGGPPPGSRVAVAARDRSLSRGHFHRGVPGTRWTSVCRSRPSQHQSLGSWADWGGGDGGAWLGGGCGHAVDTNSRTGPQLPCDMTGLITRRLGLTYRPPSPTCQKVGPSLGLMGVMVCGWCEEQPVWGFSPLGTPPHRRSV